MGKLETISTVDVRARDKLDFWNRAVSGTLKHVVAAEPIDALGFSGRITQVHLGAVQIAEICAGPEVVTRRPVRGRDAYFVLQQVLSGDIVCRSQGVQRRLGPGDFRLYDSGSDGTLLVDGPGSELVVRFPRDQVLRYIACPEALTTLVISGKSGAGALVSRFMNDLWTTITSAEVVDLGPHISDIALQLVAVAYAGVPDAKTNGTCLITWHRARIRAYIEEHLCEPDLSPRTIADALKISTGYMHRIFRSGNESVARYVLRRRLEECHRALSDPMRLPRGVTSIAFSHGFNSLPYFCRTFRDRYGVTASDFQHFRTFGADTDATDPARQAPGECRDNRRSHGRGQYNA